MDYLFDSDAVSVLYDGHRKACHETIHQKVTRLTDEDRLQVSILLIYELEYSFCNAPSEKRVLIRNTIHAVKKDFDAILPLSSDAASFFGEMKARLKIDRNLSRKEMIKHNIDIMIASTAICSASVLISADRIYEDLAVLFPGLRVENWLT